MLWEGGGGGDRYGNSVTRDVSHVTRDSPRSRTVTEVRAGVGEVGGGGGRKEGGGGGGGIGARGIRGLNSMNKKGQKRESQRYNTNKISNETYLAQRTC